MNLNKKCRICGHELRLFPAAQSPIAGYKCAALEESLEQKSFAMNFLFCPGCGMLRHEYFPEAGEILDRLYKQHHSTYYLTEKMSRYLHRFVEELTRRYGLSNAGRVLEIGCNDGRLLSLFKASAGCDVIGVEPAKTFVNDWQRAGIQVINDYFNEAVTRKLKNKKFDLIISRHVCEHIPDPVSFFRDMAQLADLNTIIIIEVPYLKTILEKKRIDNTGYSHLNYFSIRSMDAIVKQFDMGIVDFSLEETDGGAIVFHIKKDAVTKKKLLDSITGAEIGDFLDAVEETKARIRKRLQKYAPAEIAGYGAGAKGSHLIYILELQDMLGAVVDDTPAHKDKYIPGTRIRVKHPAYLEEGRVKAVLNLAPTHPEAIRAKVPAGIDFIDIFTDT